MFKIINDKLINTNNINKVEYVGLDEKDNKHYCRIFMIGGDLSGFCVEGTLEDVQNLLNK